MAAYRSRWPVDKAAEEAAWIEEVARETGWPHATVAYADMTVEDARPALDRLARHYGLRGDVSGTGSGVRTWLAEDANFTP